MTRCFVPGCNSTNYGRRLKEGVTFHLIPKYFTKEWLMAIGRPPDLIVTHERVCSDHFRDNEFEPCESRRRIKPGVIPSQHFSSQRSIPDSARSFSELHNIHLTKRRYNTWMRALGRDPIAGGLCNRNVVCSDHFLASDKIVKNSKTLLKDEAVPCLKLKLKSLQHQSEVVRARKWVVSSDRNLLKKVDTSNNRSGDSFVPKMFNKNDIHLNSNTVPTLLPAMKGSSRGPHFDHTYTTLHDLSSVDHKEEVYNIPDINAKEEKAATMPNINEQKELSVLDINVKEEMEIFDPNINVKEEIDIYVPNLNVNEEIEMYVPNKNVKEEMELSVPNINVNKEIETSVLNINVKEETEIYVPNINVKEEIEIHSPNINVKEEIDIYVPNIKEECA